MDTPHHSRDGVVYAPVWQTWTPVHTPSSRAPSASGTDEGAVSASGVASMRERMQIARIDRRLSIHELACRVKCDAATLAAFERGDEVIDDDLQRRIRTALALGA